MQCENWVVHGAKMGGNWAARGVKTDGVLCENRAAHGGKMGKPGGMQCKNQAPRKNRAPHGMKMGNASAHAAKPARC